MMVAHGYKFHHRHSPRMMLLLVVVALLATSISAFNLGSRRLSYRPTLATHAVDCAQGQFDSLVVTASSTQPVIVDFYADWCGTWLECCVAPLFLFLRPSHALAPPHSSHLRNSLLRSLLGTAQGRASWWYVSSAPFPLVSPPPHASTTTLACPPRPPPGRPRSSSSSRRNCRR